MDEELKLIVSSSPHIRTPRDTRVIMLDVLIGLLPALIAGILFFGLNSLLITVISVLACVFLSGATASSSKRAAPSMICPPS